MSNRCSNTLWQATKSWRADHTKREGRTGSVIRFFFKKKVVTMLKGINRLLYRTRCKIECVRWRKSENSIFQRSQLAEEFFATLNGRVLNVFRRRLCADHHTCIAHIFRSRQFLLFYTEIRNLLKCINGACPAVNIDTDIAIRNRYR